MDGVSGTVGWNGCQTRGTDGADGVRSLLMVGPLMGVGWMSFFLGCGCDNENLRTSVKHTFLRTVKVSGRFCILSLSVNRYTSD
jgi:hypothetical protein